LNKAEVKIDELYTVEEKPKTTKKNATADNTTDAANDTSDS
jgi:hypoxia up-regulated 1